MQQSDYNKLQKEYEQIQSKITELEDKIYNCRDQVAVNLLRADYRQLVQQKEAIYEQVIAESHDE